MKPETYSTGGLNTVLRPRHVVAALMTLYLMIGFSTLIPVSDCLPGWSVLGFNPSESLLLYGTPTIRNTLTLKV